MYLWQCFAIFLVLYRSVVSGYGSSKEGKCPPLPTDRGINNCAEQLFESDNVRCYQDLECSGTQKCCDDGCDRYICKPAIGLPVLPVIGPCGFNVSLLTLEDTECKDKNVTYCLKDGCQKCCIHTSTCSPITGRYITKDECEKQLCKEKKCPGQGEICIMDKYLRAMCVCPKGCPKNFLGGQVCGSDKVTYPNKCEVNMTACVLGARIRVVHKGKCLKNTGPGLDPCATVRCGFYSRCRVVDGNVACVCDKGCTTEYNPKCGSDGVTYPNPCGLRSASCEQMKDITVVKDGKCEILGPDPLAICDLPRDRGHGIILEMRYFFNKTMGICQGFMYHGVNGNKNNFKTQKSCHDLCFKSVKAVCSLPRIVGPCRAAYPRWYHNAIRKQCQLFIYGGCSGNANNFLAKSECEKKCDVRKVDDICSLPKQPGICLAFYPSWYYDSTSKTCKEFIYGGCMGNGNRFSSKEECNRACGFDIDFLVVPRCETPNKFNCRSIKKCIPASSRCNGKDDCGDNSDEKNCDLAVKDPCENVTCDFYSRCASFKNGKTICECPQICTRDFRAVCGSDNKTYPNLCVMQVESCKNQETISKKSDGECGKRKRSKCQQEFAAIPEGIVGAFRPRCEKDGSYSKAQCHGSTGYCWCVDELGKKLEDTVVQFKTPNCTEEERKRSKCQQELDAIPEGIVGAFIPRCEKDGSYSKAQCHSSTAYCWCVDELGKKLEDTVVQFKTPNCTEGERKRSKCQQELDAIPEGIVGAFIPRCEKDGSYSKAQCHSSTAYCWCVDELGKKLEDTVVQFKTPNCTEGERKRSKCQQELDAIPEGIVGAFIPRCEKDGSYSKAQCHSSTAYCWCVDELGKKLEDTVVQFKTPNCTEGERKRSKCQQELDAIPEGIVGAFIPRCEKDGSYSKAQCHSSTAYCWCVDELGKKLEDTVVQFKTPNCTEAVIKDPCESVTCSFYAICVPLRNGTTICDCPKFCTREWNPLCGSNNQTYSNPCMMKVESCEKQELITKKSDGGCGSRPKSKCEKERDSEVRLFAIGAYIPRCEEDGSYSRLQCYGSTGYCWCVDKLGKKLEETKVGFKRPNCIEAPLPTNKPFDICDISLCEFGRCVNVNGSATCQCNNACTFIEQPVCGSDNKTYSNLCVMDAESCEKKQHINLQYEGPCGAPPPTNKPFDICDISLCEFGRCVNVNGSATCQCNNACPRIEQPVCGSDNKTYSNLCVMDAESCEKKQHINLQYDGPCGAPPPTNKPFDICDISLCEFGRCVNVNGSATCQCNNACPRIELPVCGSDNKTYSNLCVMDAESCEKKQHINLQYDGPCGAPPPTNKPFDICDISLCDFGRCVNVNGSATCQCNNACTFIEQPVCGSDNKTYSNLCVMDAESCEKKQHINLQYEGPCGAPPPTNKPFDICDISLCEFGRCVNVNGSATCQCNNACPRIEQPVCGSDNKTYSNLCVMDAESCEKKQHINLQYDGPCGAPPPTNKPFDICDISLCEFGRCVNVNGSATCQCNNACTFIEQPVCGSDNKTYSNLCVMDAESCEKKQHINLQYEGPCGAPPPTNKPFDICDISLCDFGRCVNVNGSATCQCNNACTFIEQPVCGTDNKTYSNLCVMDAESCEKKQHIKIQHEGPCEGPGLDPCATVRCGFYSKCRVVDGKAACVCDKGCTREYNPKCGSDGVTYPNPCVLRSASCKQMKDITVVKDGKCETTIAGVTFGDPCATVQCSFYSKCRVVDGKAACVCNKGCTRELNPKCGSDGVTYSNPCVLRSASCEQMKEITVVKDGECEREIKRCRICPASENQQVVKSFCNRLNRFGIIGTLVDIQRNASKGKLKITVNITKRYKPRKLGKSNLNKKNLVTITIVGMKEDCRCENLELNINDDYVFIGRRSKKNKLFIKGGKSFVQKADGKIVKTLWKGFKGRAKNWSYCQKFRG